MLRDKNLIQILRTILLLIADGVASFVVGSRFFRYSER